MNKIKNQFLSVDNRNSAFNGIKKKFGLSKDEIIRGHNVYSEILKNSMVFNAGLLKVFLEKNLKTDKNKVINDISSSPLLTNNVKVGFIIAKKRIRRAVLRNRIRRLLRESYRVRKDLFSNSGDTRIIFSLNEKGYEFFKEFPDSKINNIDSGIIKAAEMIKKYFSEK